MKRCLSCGASFSQSDWTCPACGFSPHEENGFLRFPTDVPTAAFPNTFETLARLEPTSFWFRARNELIAWAVARYFPDARTMLEVGCGTGFVLEGLATRFPRLALSGLEPFVGGLDVARRRVPEVPLYIADGKAVPFESEFDLVGCFDVLEHVEDDERVLGELRRALVSGGGALVTVPQHPRLWAPVDDFSGHRRRYTRRELRSKLLEAGFRPLRETSFVSLILPLTALSRLVHRGDPAEYDPATEFRLPRKIDRALGAVMEFERRAIAAGCSFPIGSSLLVIARRD